MKLKDFVNQTKNKNNKQISLNVKKTELKRMNLDIKDILSVDIPLAIKLKKFKEL